MVQRAPAACLQDSPKEDIELPGRAWKHVKIVAAGGRHAHVTGISASRRQRPVVRLQHISPVVILNAEDSPFRGALFQSKLFSQSQRKEAYIELRVTPLQKQDWPEQEADGAAVLPDAGLQGVRGAPSEERHGGRGGTLLQNLQRVQHR